MNNKFLRVFYFILTAIFIFSSTVYCEVVFRFDDYPSMDSELLELQNKVILMFKEKEIPLTIAVLPSRLNDLPAAVVFLKNNFSASIEIALHGWDHSNMTGHKIYEQSSEFAGVAYEEQLVRIQKGISAFENVLLIKPVTFTPPFNTYDSNTVKILKKLDFKNISAGYAGEEIEYEGLNIIPETCLLKDLKDLNIISNKLYIIMFHEYDFKESGSGSAYFTIGELNNLLDKLRGIDDLEFSTISGLADKRKNLFNGERINSVVPLLKYIATPLFCFPAHWIMHLPYYYGNEDFYGQKLKSTKLLGLVLDGVFLALVVMLAFLAKKIFNLLNNKSNGNSVIIMIRVFIILIIMFMFLNGIARYKQGKNQFAYKYRCLFIISLAILGATFKKK